MTVEDKIALQIGRAAMLVARLETELEEARQRIAVLEAQPKPETVRINAEGQGGVTIP